MHPADVVDHVATSVDELRTRVSAYSELSVTNVTLEAGTMLYVSFEKMERQLVRVDVPSSIVLPGGGGVAVQYEVPDLGARPVARQLILHLELSGYDATPPTAELLLADRSPLPAEEWPVLGNGGIVPRHPDFQRPYFCRRGLREYHSHPQHEDNPWDRYREGLPLHAIVLELLDDLQHRWIGRR